MFRKSTSALERPVKGWASGWTPLNEKSDPDQASTAQIGPEWRIQMRSGEPSASTDAITSPGLIRTRLIEAPVKGVQGSIRPVYLP